MDINNKDYEEIEKKKIIRGVSDNEGYRKEINQDTQVVDIQILNPSNEVKNIQNQENSQEEEKQQEALRIPVLTQKYLCNTYKTGNTILLCGKKDGMFPLQCLIGPDWLCMLVTYSLVIGPSICYYIYVAGNLHWAVDILISLTFASTLISFSLIACSDPGIVYQPFSCDYELTHNQRTVVCSKCHIRRPTSAMHCWDCNVCIEELDHHCPWTGKCIGKKTIRYFYIFLTSVMTHIVVLATTSIYYAFLKRE